MGIEEAAVDMMACLAVQVVDESLAERTHMCMPELTLRTSRGLCISILSSAEMNEAGRGCMKSTSLAPRSDDVFGQLTYACTATFGLKDPGSIVCVPLDYLDIDV